MFDERTRLVARQLRKRPTRSEAILWSALRKRKLDGVKFRRQHVIGRYIADFYAAAYRLVVEVDGGVHDDEYQRRHDQLRDECLSANAYRVLRIDAHIVEQNLPRALEMIRIAVRASQ